MIPLRLSARNYGPYASVEFDIPAGLTAVVGVNTLGDGADSNGSGKTKLLELLPIAIYGPPMPWSEYLTLDSDETTCTVEIEFEHAGEMYRIRRTFDAKGRGKTTLDFEQYGGVDSEQPGFVDAWGPLTMSNQRDTQALIEKTIGIGEQTFAHSVFAAQGARHFADPTLPPAERKAILAEALQLGRWDELLKAVKVEVSEVERDIAAIDARIGAFQEDVAQKADLEREVFTTYTTVMEAQKEVANLADALEKATDAFEATKAVNDQRSNLVNAAATAERVYLRIAREEDAARDAAETLRGLLTETEQLQAISDTLPTLEEEAQRLALASAERSNRSVHRATLWANAEKARERCAKALDEEAQMKEKAVQLGRESLATAAGELPCSACGQPLTGEALTKALSTISANVTILENRAAELHETVQAEHRMAIELKAEADAIEIPEPLPEAELEAKRQALMLTRAAAAKLPVLEERRIAAAEIISRGTTDEFLAEIAEARADRDATLKALEDAPVVSETTVAELQRAKSDAFVAHRDAQVLLSDAERAQATVEERLRSLKELQERSAEALAARVGLQGRRETLLALQRAYGRDGIPALILEATAIPQLEVEANRILSELGAPFRFELVTQRENKGGGLKDTLDVMVHGEKGTLRYESYSGGEQTRLAFALRVSLARLIASRRSAQAGVLVLDELPFLDGSGIGKVCEVLRGLTEFRSILLVSHDDRFVDAFDQTVTVTRDESGSRIEESA